jgi:hypothetical protein
MDIITKTTASEMGKGGIAHNNPPISGKTETEGILPSDGDAMPVDFGYRARMLRTKYWQGEPVDEHGMG